MTEIIQNGYKCPYEMKLFSDLFFSEEEDVVIMQNFTYSDKIINTYTHIIYNGKSYFEDHSHNTYIDSHLHPSAQSDPSG